MSLRMFEPSAVVRLNRKNERLEQSTILRRMGDKRGIHLLHSLALTQWTQRLPRFVLL